MVTIAGDNPECGALMVSIEYRNVRLARRCAMLQSCCIQFQKGRDLDATNSDPALHAPWDASAAGGV
jgi:hypothetical protein